MAAQGNGLGNGSLQLYSTVKDSIGIAAAGGPAARQQRHAATLCARAATLCARAATLCARAATPCVLGGPPPRQQ
eukprot:scaffold7171_cov30-Phaeocystis_antarctica.AAC.1